MGGFLRRRFWIVNLIIIGILAGIGAHAVRQALEATFVPEEAPAGPSRTASPAVPTARAKPMLAHNIFCSTCPPPAPGAGPSGEVGAREPASRLPVALVGTLVTPEAIRSVAVIRDRGAAPARPPEAMHLFPVAAYRPGDRVAGYPAVVERIEARRVWLRVNGRLEYVDLIQPAPPRPEPGPELRRPPGPRRAPRGAT